MLDIACGIKLARHGRGSLVTWASRRACQVSSIRIGAAVQDRSVCIEYLKWNRPVAPDERSDRKDEKSLKTVRMSEFHNTVTFSLDWAEWN